MKPDEEERIRQEIVGAVIRRTPDTSAPPAPALPEKPVSPSETPSSTSARLSSLLTHPLAIPAVVVITVVVTLLAVYAGTKLIGSKDAPTPTAKQEAVPQDTTPWVLWIKFASTRVAGVEGTWKPYETYAGQAKCEQAKLEEYTNKPGEGFLKMAECWPTGTTPR